MLMPVARPLKCAARSCGLLDSNRKVRKSNRSKGASTRKSRRPWSMWSEEGDREGLMLKSLLLFGCAVALCGAAFAQSTFRWEQGNTYSHNSYRYKSIGFQNIVVQLANAPSVFYGVRQFAAFRLIVLNQDK